MNILVIKSNKFLMNQSQIIIVIMINLEISVQ